MNKDNFLKNIRENEEQTNFKLVCLNQMDFATKSGIPFLIGSNQYVLNDYSFNMYLQRIGLNCPALNEPEFRQTNNSLVTDLVNQVLAGDKEVYSLLYYKEEANGKKVLAAHSKNYKPLTISTLIESLERKLNQEYEEVEFLNGFTNDEITICDFKVKSAAFNQAYKKIFNTSDLSLIIRFTTSNLGLSGANLFPSVMAEGKVIPIAERAISLKHEGEASLTKFENNITYMFNQAEVLPEKIEELSKISIQYPTHCLINLAEKVGINAKDIAPVAETCSFIFINTCVTGKDIYFLLADVIEREKDTKKQNDLIEKVGKAMRVLKEHSAELDVPKINWKRLKVSAEEGQEFIPIAQNQNDFKQIAFFN